MTYLEDYRIHWFVRRVATALVVACLGLALISAAHAAVPSTLYSPSLANYPNASASSPRVITLSHSGRYNGVMLATFDNGNTFAHTDGQGTPPSFAIHASLDEGVHWLRQPLAVVRDVRHGWGFAQQPMLLEVPRQLGGPDGPGPGTLLLVGNYEAPNVAEQDLEVYKSTDHGRSWSYLSSCATGGGSGHGIWEPYLQVDANGNLDCYFSDERQNSSGYSQIIGHVTSTDGGRTWGPETDDVGIADGKTRPGMPSVVPMSNGRYAMVFETVGQADSQVHIKFSSDGTHWGAESDLGTLIATADGHFLGATPELMAIPPTREFPSGELVLAAKAYFDSAGTESPASGNVLLVNTSDGTGPWSRAPAPMGLNPAPTISPDCNNYKPALAWTGRGNKVTELAPRLLSPGVCEIVSATANVTPAAEGATVVSTAVGPDSRPWALWKYPDNHVALWVITADGSSLVRSSSYNPKAGSSIAGLAIGADNRPRLIWNNIDGTATLWTLSRNGRFVEQIHSYTAPGGTVAQAIAAGPDGQVRILWSASSGQAAIWTLDAACRKVLAAKNFAIYPGWIATGLSVGTDNDPRILWTNTSGAIAIWTQSEDGSTTLNNYQYGPFLGTRALAIASGSDNQVRVLWSATDGHINLWTMDSIASTLVSNSAFGPYEGAAAASIGVGGNNDPRILWASTGDFMDLWTMSPDGSTLLFNYSGTPVAGVRRSERSWFSRQEMTRFDDNPPLLRRALLSR